MPLIAPDPDVVEVRPQRRRHPGLVMLGTVLVTGALVWGGFTATEADDQAALPTPDRVGTTTLTPAQKTALAWNEWTAATVEAACLDEAGHDIEPAVIAYRTELSEVAALLTVHAVEPEALAGYLPREGAVPMELLRGIDSGGCRVVRDLLDLDDDALVESLVREAMSDEAFRSYLAGVLWVEANPAAVLASYLDLVEPGADVAEMPWDATAASAALETAVAVAREATTWSPLGVSEGTGYVQAWGQAASGSAILLRVEPRNAEHRDPILWGSPERPVECGGLQVSLSMGEVLINYDGPQRGEVFTIRDALEETWCSVAVEAVGGGPVVAPAGEA